MAKRTLTYAKRLRNTITARRVRSLTAYNRATGVLTWLYRPNGPAAWNTRFSGREVGSVNKAGYRVCQMCGFTVAVHQLIWLHVTGKWPSAHVDHRNRIGADNRWKNLRCASCAQNLWNSKINKRNTSGYKGVYRNGPSWSAQITAHRRHYYLGSFPTKRAAFAAYRSFAKKLHGQFARH